jgi:SPP1 gp7 family putative phage head morphogenesis protein
MEETGAEIERQTGVSAERAMLIARTEVQNLHNRQNDLLYRTSRDVLAGLRFVATLDPRTCPDCARLDGVLYYFSGHAGEPRAPGPRLPLHPACRCCYAPVTKTWDELGIDLPDVPAEARASWGGPAPARMTFYQWLKVMPRGVIADVLGRSRAEAFIAGDWKPSALIRGAAKHPEALKAVATRLRAGPPLAAEAEATVRNIISKARKNQGVASVRPLSPGEEAAGEEGRGIEVRYRNGGSTILSVDPSSRGETLKELRSLIRRYRLPGLPPG